VNHYQLMGLIGVIKKTLEDVIDKGTVLNDIKIASYLGSGHRRAFVYPYHRLLFKHAYTMYIRLKCLHKLSYISDVI
jgi:hypothetical protein